MTDEPRFDRLRQLRFEIRTAGFMVTVAATILMAVTGVAILSTASIALTRISI